MVLYLRNFKVTIFVGIVVVVCGVLGRRPVGGPTLKRGPSWFVFISTGVLFLFCRDIIMTLCFVPSSADGIKGFGQD